jgi:hypothetical protein
MVSKYLRSPDQLRAEIGVTAAPAKPPAVVASSLEAFIKSLSSRKQALFKDLAVVHDNVVLANEMIDTREFDVLHSVMPSLQSMKKKLLGLTDKLDKAKWELGNTFALNLIQDIDNTFERFQLVKNAQKPPKFKSFVSAFLDKQRQRFGGQSGEFGTTLQGQSTFKSQSSRNVPFAGPPNLAPFDTPIYSSQVIAQAKSPSPFSKPVLLARSSSESPFDAIDTTEKSFSVIMPTKQHSTGSADFNPFGDFDKPPTQSAAPSDLKESFGFDFERPGNSEKDFRFDDSQFLNTSVSVSASMVSLSAQPPTNPSPFSSNFAPIGSFQKPPVASLQGIQSPVPPHGAQPPTDHTKKPAENASDINLLDLNFSPQKLDPPVSPKPSGSVFDANVFQRANDSKTTANVSQLPSTDPFLTTDPSSNPFTPSPFAPHSYPKQLRYSPIQHMARPACNEALGRSPCRGSLCRASRLSSPASKV